MSKSQCAVTVNHQGNIILTHNITVLYLEDFWYQYTSLGAHTNNQKKYKWNKKSLSRIAYFVVKITRALPCTRCLQRPLLRPQLFSSEFLVNAERLCCKDDHYIFHFLILISFTNDLRYSFYRLLKCSSFRKIFIIIL